MFDWDNNWKEVVERVGTNVIRRKDGKPFVRNEMLAQAFVIGIGGMCAQVHGENGFFREIIAIEDPDNVESTGERYLFKLCIQGTNYK